MKRFLIVKPSSLGDVIHAFPAVTLLSRQEPGAVIDWLVVPGFAPIVRYPPAVREILPFRRKEMGQISKFPKAFRSPRRSARNCRRFFPIRIASSLSAEFGQNMKNQKKISKNSLTSAKYLL